MSPLHFTPLLTPRIRSQLPTWATLTLSIACAAVLVLLEGCATPGATPKPLALTPPAALGLAPANAPVNAPVNAAPIPPLAGDWWTGWGDPALNRLIEQALRDAPSLQAAAARVQRAAALADLNRAADGPHLGVSASLTRQRYSENGLFPPPIAGGTFNSGDVSLGLDWSPDFFGRNQAALQAALGSQRALVADAAAARTLIASQVARAHIGLARLLAQREIATRVLTQREQLLSLIRQRVSAGLDTEVELRQGEGALPEARLQIEQIDEQVALARHQLATLSAQPIEALATFSPALPAAMPDPALSQLGADLLGRRPDVVAARWRVEAATHDVQGAQAAFYPDVRLSAFVGLSAIGLDRLFDFGSRTLGAGPAIHLPIFDGGALRAQLQGRSADLDGAIAQYNGVVREAVRDASDALAVTVSLQRQRTEQASALASAERAHALAQQRYAAGLGNYLVVLQAETQLLNQRRGTVDLQARTLDNQAALMKSLGGGWRDETATVQPPATPSTPSQAMSNQKAPG